eukprot:3751242-Rhodomonas_salina.2
MRHRNLRRSVTGVYCVKAQRLWDCMKAQRLWDRVSEAAAHLARASQRRSWCRRGPQPKESSRAQLSTRIFLRANKRPARSASGAGDVERKRAVDTVRSVVFDAGVRSDRVVPGRVLNATSGPNIA